MKELNEKPTSKFYGLFQYIFDYYNEYLFDDKIKDCIIIIERGTKSMGHFAFKKWYQIETKETDELALNASQFLKYPLIEICQTVVHEMCHSWQCHYGKPSRRGYHNKEFAKKMIEVGLMPSDTGKEGGKQTGQNMADYPIENGLFLDITEDLMNNEIFSNLFYEVNPALLDLLDENKPAFEQIKDLTLSSLEEVKQKPKSKLKYSCGCSNVWGKSNLNIICGNCGNPFATV